MSIHRTTDRRNRHHAAAGARSPRRSRSAGLLGKALAAAMLLGTVLGATSMRADAALGQSVTIPGLHGCASGSGSLTSMSGGTAKGTIRLTTSCSGRKYYVQIALALPNSPDFSSWQKVGAEIDGSGSRTFSWTDNFSGPYNGVKFRICQQKTLASDPCASASATIKK